MYYALQRKKKGRNINVILFVTVGETKQKKVYYNPSKNFDDRMSSGKEECFVNRSEAPGQYVQHRDGSFKRNQKRESHGHN
jgi:hypothetical protein